MFTEERFKKGELLLIDKPLYWSSFQAVNKIKWEIKKKFGLKKIKVGHAGTLDPLATGLLLICTGNFTKNIQEFQNQTKSYTGTFTLGATTPSYDRETRIDAVYATSHLTHELIYKRAAQFIGEIAQLPPVFSALKKEGKRFYEFAREGQAIKITPRKVEIIALEITKIELPEVDFKVMCSKGTYIRSLAHDFGKALKSGAYLSALRRTEIGDYSVAQAISPEAFAAQLRQ